jgi:hypothetical protein
MILFIIDFLPIFTDRSPQCSPYCAPCFPLALNPVLSSFSASSSTRSDQNHLVVCNCLVLVCSFGLQSPRGLKIRRIFLMCSCGFCLSSIFRLVISLPLTCRNGPVLVLDFMPSCIYPPTC